MKRKIRVSKHIADRVLCCLLDLKLGDKGSMVKPVSVKRYGNGEIYYTFEPGGYDFDYVGLAYSNPSKISGMPTNQWKRTQGPPSEEKREKHGIYVKAGKLVKYLMVSKDPQVISLVTQRLVMLNIEEASDDGDIRISEKPSEIYGMIATDRGQLGSSCMNNKDPEYFRLYDAIDTCQILYRTKEDKDTGKEVLISRALLWNHVEILGSLETKVVRVVDRIYSESDNDIAYFRRWAKENGALMKEHQGSDDYNLIDPMDTKIIYSDYRVPLGKGFREKAGLREMPYVDTFFSVVGKPPEYLYASRYGGNVGYLRNTEGCDETSLFVSCECHGCSKEIFWDERHQGTGYKVLCEDCGEEYLECDRKREKESKGSWVYKDFSEGYTRISSEAEERVIAQESEPYRRMRECEVQVHPSLRVYAEHVWTLEREREEAEEPAERRFIRTYRYRQGE